MKNKLEDLHNHLMARLEKLGDEDVKGKDLQDEIARSKATTDVAVTMIDNAKLALDVERHYARQDRLEREGRAVRTRKRPAMLTVDHNGS